MNNIKAWQLKKGDENVNKYGLNSIIEFYFDESKTEGKLGRVINQQRSYLEVVVNNILIKCSISGKLIHNNTIPVIGDWVIVDNDIIVEILPRHNSLSRRSNEKKVTEQVIASHIDKVFIVLSANEIREGLLNSMINLASDLNFAILVNKTDLVDQSELKNLKAMLEKKYGEFDVVYTNIFDEKSIDEFRNLIEDYKTYTFLGKSGVGKSSLINKIMGQELLRVGEIHEKSNRGKHTTTNKQLYTFNNSCIIDIPGIRKFVSWINDDDGLLYQEIKELAKECKFNNCTHTNEPDCNVRDNIDKALLDEYHKYQDYQVYLKRNESVIAAKEYSTKHFRKSKRFYIKE